MKSYTATRTGPIGRVSEFWNLYRWKRADVPGRVRRTLAALGEAEATLEEALGSPLRDQNILVIGPGQHRIELTFFGRMNRVLGIDLDVVLDGNSLRGYWMMLRENGPVRVLKTIGRRIMGIEAAFERELVAVLGLNARVASKISRMDAAAMDLSDKSVDCVYSHSVFEHLPDPESVMREIRRVLRPRGVCYIAVHLYTSDSGCHDPRIFSGRRAGLPYWAHLRPEHAARIRPNAYLNELRLDEWQALFRRCWPGAELRVVGSRGKPFTEALAEARAAGELVDYSDEELLNDTLVAVWQKTEGDQKNS